MSKEKIQIEVNGKRVVLEVEPDALLVDVLRRNLGLTGTKAGCRAGECGACSVILNGKVNGKSCELHVMDVFGREVKVFKVFTGKDAINLDISGLKPGVYFLYLMIDGILGKGEKIIIH